MKLFAFGLALLVLVVSCLPCADGNFATKAKADGVEFVKSSDNQQTDNHLHDCSPFCQCGCCAGFSIDHYVSDILSLHPLTISHLSYFPSSDITGIALPVWQPPQLI